MMSSEYEASEKNGFVMLKKMLKNLLLVSAPKTAAAFFASRARRHASFLEHHWGLVNETNRYVKRYGDTVLRGPFQGLIYPRSVLERSVANKLIGTYELELHSFLEEAIKSGPQRVIDVGSAEGYYAVGLARRLPDATVFAFDADRWARKRTAEMAHVNGVTNLNTFGLCSKRWLFENVRDKTFVVMDCEGCEAELLSATPRLVLPRLSWWLIELHETRAPGVTDSLRQRFNKTHHTELCPGRIRKPEDCPEFLKFAMDLAIIKLLDEHRDPGQQWLLCRPRTV